MDGAQRSQCRLDRSSLRAAGPSPIGTALYNAPDAIASLKNSRSHPAWTEARSQSRAQGGLGPGSYLLPGTRFGFFDSSMRDRARSATRPLFMQMFRII
jgi:hypothetical protein